MAALTAVVLGASGLIGQQLVEELLKDNSFEKVRLLVRKPLQHSHAKLEQLVVDFNDHEQFKAALGNGDCIFCCVGTTQAKVKGDKAAYRKVDYDIPVNAAKFGKEAGFKKYLLVSSVGASEKASNFYLKLKGEVETAIISTHFESLHIFRPSMLLGNRSEVRVGEMIAKKLMQVFSFALIGSMKKYKGIQASTVAKAMVAAAKQTSSGVTVYEYEQMR